MAKFKQTLSQDLRTEIDALGRIHVIAENESILFQGEPTQNIGFILSGRAKATSFAQDGSETWLGRFEPGEFFGHIAFLTQNEVRYEISAESDMSLRLIPVAEINSLMERAPQIGEVFARDLAQRLDVMMSRLVEALTLSAKGRVCAELWRLSNPIGHSPHMSVIRPNPVFVDLALRISSSRETVSRTVSELQKQGVIKREAGAILIENPDALKRAMR